VENFFIGNSLSTGAQPITAITRRGLLVVVVAGSGLARYTEITLSLNKKFTLNLAKFNDTSIILVLAVLEGNSTDITGLLEHTLL